MHPYVKPLGLIAAFWLLVLSVAIPVFKAAVARSAIRPEVDCLQNDRWSFFSRRGAVSEGKLGTTTTLRIAVEKAGKDHFDVGASHPIDVRFVRGDLIKLMIRGRCSEPSRIRMVLHKNPGGDGVLWMDLAPVGTKWTEIRRSIPAPAIPVGDAILSIFVGEKTGVYEFDKVQMVKARAATR